MKGKEQLRLLILAILSRQPEHGYAIAQAIKLRSDGLLQAREGLLYPALHALETEGLITSSEEQENGRPRRVYQLTKSGQAALKKATAQWERHTNAVSAVLGGHG